MAPVKAHHSNLFTLPVRVYYEDTDFSGVVYHASYLRFMERGRTEMIRGLGLTHRDLFEGGVPVAFAVRAMKLDFLRSALIDDELIVETMPVTMRGASMDLTQRVRRGTEMLVTADIKVVCVGGGKARRIPDVIRDALSKLVEPGLADG